MHRPTRQNQHLAVKLEQKTAKSRRVGKKARRMKKWLAAYKDLGQTE